MQELSDEAGNERSKFTIGGHDISVVGQSNGVTIISATISADTPGLFEADRIIDLIRDVMKDSIEQPPSSLTRLENQIFFSLNQWERCPIDFNKMNADYESITKVCGEMEGLSTIDVMEELVRLKQEKNTELLEQVKRLAAKSGFGRE